MRSDAKAATAGSKQRRIGRKPALLLVSAAACLAALALVVGPASGATTRFLVEVFGSAAQPSFPGDRGMAVDQGSGELYVLESESDEIRRYNSDGTPSDFAALGSNVIDGEGAGDEIPEGSLAFPFSRSESQIAIDESGGATDGNVYVTESTRDQVSIFDAEGNYLGELSEHSGGTFSEPLGVAVDPSGNVYVGDFSAEDLVHKYEPAANPPVNGDHAAAFNSLAGISSPGTLAAGAGATAGFIFVNRFNGEMFKLDSTTGELKYQVTTGAATSYVDPASGHVFAVKGFFESSSVDEYDASGAGSATLVSSFKPGSTVEGVAVNSGAEEVYVSREGTQNVEVFGPAAVIPDVVTQAPTSNTGTRATLAGTVNPDGVELDECFFQWGRASFQGGEGILENTTPCAETPAEIGTGTSPVAVHADITGLVPQGAAYQFRLVAVNPNATVNGSNQNFTTPNTVVTQAASGVTSTEATLNGTVNPDTATISECVFEWGLEKGPLEPTQTFPETTPCVPGTGAITGESPVAVEADISGLHPGTPYVYRLKAAYPNKTVTTAAATVQTLGPRIAATWSEDVVFTEAILRAQIDPEGKATTYHFEYGTSEAYGQETEELAVGSDSSVHQVAQFLQGLQPDTSYHYRVVATNSDGVNEGPDHVLTTFKPESQDTDCPNNSFRVGPSARLPDCRVYELVSPLDKNGGDIATATSPEYVRASFNKAAASGQRLTYSSATSFGDQLSSLASNQYIASRTAMGWSSHGINPPRTTSQGITNSLDYTLGLRFRAFTDDLSSAWMRYADKTPLSPDSPPDFAHLYRRDNITDSWQLLTVNTPTVAQFKNQNLMIKGFTEDAGHAVFAANAALTPDAAPNAESQVYDFSDGDLRLVSILPNGDADPGRSLVGGATAGVSGFDSRGQLVDRAVSEDGSRIFWTQYVFGGGKIYVRIDGETTLPVSQAVSDDNALFWTASVDGSRAVFTVNPAGAQHEPLYEVNVDTGTPSLIAADAFGVVGASEDLSYLYFVSPEALDAGATAGDSNLYLRHKGAIELIATLSNDGGWNMPVSRIPLEQASRVTSDGRHLAFMSTRSLTGYDNTDAVGAGPEAQNGSANFEVFLYDADSDQLSCVSCNPSGARPHGEYLQYPYRSITVDERQGPLGEEFWGAAWIPTWEHETYASRVLSEDGNRLFFNSSDALVPQDTNGAQDVYQWETQGSGNCDKPDGCVSLISTGQNPVRSEFIDASTSGDEVFIETESSIDPRDPGLIDIYVAKVNGGYPITSVATDCQGENCEAASSAPKDPTPASATFEGAGNPRIHRLSRPRCPRGKRKVGKGRRTRCAPRCPRGKRKVGKGRRTRCAPRCPRGKRKVLKGRRTNCVRRQGKAPRGRQGRRGSNDRRAGR